MSQTQLITTVLDWERRLEIEEEKRKSGRGNEPYVNYLAPVEGPRQQRPSLFARIFRPRVVRQPVERDAVPQPCPEPQPC